MGRYPGAEKRRGRGCSAGAEDGERWAERVRSNAADWRDVGHAKAAIILAAFLWLDGEGVFEVLHARFQVIEALLLLG
jgi:hypothetical protein